MDDGDFVIGIRAFGMGSPKPGQVVVLRHEELGTMVKRVASCPRPGRILVGGDSAASTSPVDIGEIPVSDVVARVVWVVRKPAKPLGFQRFLAKPRGRDKPALM